MKLLRFLSYNNAVPVAISLVLLGAGSAFAAGNPEAILTSEQKVLTVDNTYIAGVDLSLYTPKIEITLVSEDEHNYYVGYNFTTIDIKDYVWRDVVKSEVMQISKKELSGDLGLYVTKRLHDVVVNTRTYLLQVQEKERKLVTQQTVATIYSGLVGKFLDVKTETLPGYTPVITPPPVELSAAVVASDTEQSHSNTQSVGGGAQVSLQVLGNNPAQVPLGAGYVDLGVVLLDPYNTNVGVHTFLNGVETVSPSIDTSTSSAHTIEYRVTDRAGNAVLVRRIVLVGAALDPGGAISASGPIVAQPVAPIPPAPQVNTPVPSIETPIPAIPTEQSDSPTPPAPVDSFQLVPETSTSTEAVSSDLASPTDVVTPSESVI